jgi:hypothetical protein
MDAPIFSTVLTLSCFLKSWLRQRSVKVDDLSRAYHQAEIEAIRKAIGRTGR